MSLPQVLCWQQKLAAAGFSNCHWWKVRMDEVDILECENLAVCDAYDGEINVFGQQFQKDSALGYCHARWVPAGLRLSSWWLDVGMDQTEALGDRRFGSCKSCSIELSLAIPLGTQFWPIQTCRSPWIFVSRHLRAVGVLQWISDQQHFVRPSTGACEEESITANGLDVGWHGGKNHWTQCPSLRHFETYTYHQVGRVLRENWGAPTHHNWSFRSSYHQAASEETSDQWLFFHPLPILPSLGIVWCHKRIAQIYSGVEKMSLGAQLCSPAAWAAYFCGSTRLVASTAPTNTVSPCGSKGFANPTAQPLTWRRDSCHSSHQCVWEPKWFMAMDEDQNSWDFPLQTLKSAGMPMHPSSLRRNSVSETLQCHIEQESTALSAVLKDHWEDSRCTKWQWAWDGIQPLMMWRQRPLNHGFFTTLMRTSMVPIYDCWFWHTFDQKWSSSRLSNWRKRSLQMESSVKPHWVSLNLRPSRKTLFWHLGKCRSLQLSLHPKLSPALLWKRPCSPCLRFNLALRVCSWLVMVKRMQMSKVFCVAGTTSLNSTLKDRTGM